MSPTACRELSAPRKAPCKVYPFSGGLRTHTPHIWQCASPAFAAPSGAQTCSVDCGPGRARGWRAQLPPAWVWAPPQQHRGSPSVVKLLASRSLSPQTERMNLWPGHPESISPAQHPASTHYQSAVNSVLFQLRYLRQTPVLARCLPAGNSVPGPRTVDPDSAMCWL